MTFLNFLMTLQFSVHINGEFGSVKLIRSSRICNTRFMKWLLHLVDILSCPLLITKTSLFRRIFWTVRRREKIVWSQRKNLSVKKRHDSLKEFLKMRFLKSKLLVIEAASMFRSDPNPIGEFGSVTFFYSYPDPKIVI